VIQSALDVSSAWYQVCDEIRSQTMGLNLANAVWIYPSLESALIELSFLLADRERETGGVRNIVVYPRSSDPALEAMASHLSSAGLDNRAFSEKDFADSGVWVPAVKASCLLVAMADNDRFSGRVRNLSGVLDAVFAAGNKIPCLRVSFESRAFEKTKPKPFEIFINVQVNGAAVVLLGDRFRLNPRIAPFAMTHASLREYMSSLALSAGSIDRSKVEEFESILPPSFRPVFAPGDSRLLDRAMWIANGIDGSFLRDRILQIVERDFNAFKQVVEIGLGTLSGCWGADANLSNDFAIADERRQDWLRSRGMDPLSIRGTMVLSSRAIETIGKAGWQKVMAEAAK
jgi:hypothetical protein